jgi:hypothetical protein
MVCLTPLNCATWLDFLSPQCGQTITALLAELTKTLISSMIGQAPDQKTRKKLQVAEQL